MEIKKLNNKIIIYNVQNFDLSQIFECGQCFRWHPIKNKYCGIINNKIIYIFFENKNLIIENIDDKEFDKTFKQYLGLDINYEEIMNKLYNLHPVLNNAIDYCSGIRILLQDPWETLCSFIISQNNNIPRIKKIIDALCKNFGEKIIENVYSFPTAQKPSNLTADDLKIIKCGFRDKYILNAAQKIANNEINLEIIKKEPLNIARATLQTIKGVGPKVAECVLLYGMGRLEAFPIDVWIKKVINTYFKDFDIQKACGKYAGIAQQYLYHYSRTKLDKNNLLLK